MTTLREAAQQALEALKGYRRELGDQQPCDAEQALEAALAELVEPCRYADQCNEEGWCTNGCEHRAALAEDAMQRLTDVQQEIESAVNQQLTTEPVAWLFTNLQSGDYDFCYQEDEHDHDREMWHKQPLYTAPPQRTAEPDLFHCPKCGGPADNGHDRSIPPSPYWCTKCMAEPVQAPVAWRYKAMIGMPWSLSDDGYYISCKRDQRYFVEALYAAPPQRPAEPVQEPVAWLTPGQDLHLNNGEGFRFSDWTPLYTAPPQRKPLPASEIVTMYEENPRGDSDMIAFARAIERAHGIK